MYLEIELKLTIDPIHVKILEQHPLIREYLHGVPQHYHLISTYFDTADQRLRKNGWCLRVREWNGAYIQTLKSAGEQIGDLHHRHEWDQPIIETTPNIAWFADSQVRSQVNNVIDNQPLVNLFKTELKRTQWDLKFPDGAFVELVLDIGAARTTTAQDPINEIELELKTGEPAKLYEIADVLRKTIPLTIETRSKAERGYQLCSQMIANVTA